MSFISDYLLATSNNESPIQYHKWSCLATLSVLAGRRFWFDLGPFRYYPNFYTVLVGDPGVKKSAAMDVGKDIVRAVGGIPMAATSTTKEAITKMMGSEKFSGKKFFKNNGAMEEYNQLAIFATEFTTFLGVAPVNMVDFLTNIYSEKVYDEKYKNTGDTAFTGPYITMLACLTPNMMKGFLKLNILSGGFSRRTMFVWGSHGRPIPIPGYTEEQRAAIGRCVEWGKRVQADSGQYTFSPTGQEWYETWYKENYSKVKDRIPSTQPYYLTKHEFLIKTAMLVCLAEFPGRSIEAEHLDFVNKTFFTPVEEMLDRVFEGSGINPNSQAASQMCRMLEALGKPMSRKYLEGLFFDATTDPKSLRDTLDHLVNVGRLEQRTLIANNITLGTVIGVAGSLTGYSDVDLAVFLKPGAVPSSAIDRGLYPSTDQQ